MGKQQQQQTAAAAMSAPPRKRKKKGRPSLLDIQKRTLRLEKLQDPQPPPPPPPPPQPGPPPRRRSTRRNPALDSGDDDDDDDAEGTGRREKKVRLVMGLPDGSAKGEKTRKATDGREEPSDSGPTTPLPDKKLLLFVLDRLQKKDTYGVFSEPVDHEELPDYHDIIKHPMDFSTIKKKLDKGAYGNLEQFEDDVFLLTSNAMCYNSPDTIYYRQARAIQDLAKKDFENLRQDSDASEPEPEPEPKPDPEPTKLPPRRGRPPNKNNIKQKVGKQSVERATADFSGATLASVGNSGHRTHPVFDLQRQVMDRSLIADVLRASFANRNNEYNWSNERKMERMEDYSGTMGKWSAKSGKKPVMMEESSRSTYCQPQPSSSIYELPVSSSYNETKKLLVGVQLQQSYARSLARFAAQLGPVAWEIASKRIERVLPPGTKFGRGWVGDGEAPNTFQRPELTTSSTALTPPSSTVTSSEQATHNGPANTSHSAGPQPSSAPYASTITAQRVDCQAIPSQQHGSIPQVSVERGEHGVDVKGNHNLHERPAIQHTINGFNAVSGSTIFPSAAQMVANRIQTHTAD
uniref:Bromo domain-containing protein n=1 Tax=Leersia perrieri TaxID=77586 RepID=A0A0D9XGF2_9ORYZ